MVLIEAKVVDSTHLELSTPIECPEGRTVFIALSEAVDNDPDRREWFDLGISSLQGAYADSDPEYPDSLVKENNPDYAG